MKQLKGLLLSIACIFLLPLLQGESPFTPAEVQTALHTHFSHTTVDNSTLGATGEACSTPSFIAGPRRYNHRTRALNDYHELCLFVPSIRIKSLFVYIHAVYKGYKESYISVAVTLSDWRGPPLA